MRRRGWSLFPVLALMISLATTACVTMTPAQVQVAAPKDEVLVRARRALIAEGLQAAAQDDEAGAVFSHWVVMVSDEDSTLAYRLVVVVDDANGAVTVTTHSETQRCPPNATVFDRCAAMRDTIVSKQVQRQIDAVSARIAG